MSVLILKNISSEGPGTISSFLDGQKIPHTVIDLCAGERIPETRPFDTLVMMGGPMSVNDSIPYIEEECALTRQFIAAGKRVFGVCLGAQIMAKALGARVYPGPEKEIGWYDIRLTADGAADPAMQALAKCEKQCSDQTALKVFQWHGETFDLPVGAVPLAHSPLYRHQAFRFGQFAYAFQFHIEVTREMVYDWLKNEPIDQKALATDTESLYAAYLERAFAFYAAYFRGQLSAQEVRDEKNRSRHQTVQTG